ncbi:MAG: hypothetical protein IPN98_13090 [Propionivibrio sp.]|nr:hypothetical protein [Propionivibrio sp.]
MNSNDASSDYPLQLLRHPATPAPVVSTIEARALFRSDGFLELAFRLRGDMARLLIPTLPTEDRKLLWEHTCFEAFVASVSDTAYREFNFSPSGQWASYAFSDYRLADETAAMIDSPQITSRLFAGRMELEAVIFLMRCLQGAGSFCLGFRRSSKRPIPSMAATVTGRCAIPRRALIFITVIPSHLNW